MCDRYSAPGEDNHPDLEDEFLCEYVDGTMDPIVREVFEEYLCANPDLQEHIACLRDTRLLLCRYGCRCHAPRDLHDRLRREITCDLMDGRIPFHVLVADRLRGAATASTAMALVLFLGVIGGFSAIPESESGHVSLMSAAVISTDTAPDPVRLQPAIVIKNAPISPRYSSYGSASVAGSLVAREVGKHFLSSADTSDVLSLGEPAVRP